MRPSERDPATPHTPATAPWTACTAGPPLSPRRRSFGPVLALLGAFALGLLARELVPARAHAASSDDDPTRADARDLIRAVNEVAREIRDAARACK